MNTGSGILRHFFYREHVHLSYGDEPRIDTRVATLHFHYPGSGSQFRVTGSGTSIRDDENATLASAELIERHAIYCSQAHSLIRSTAAELGSIAVDPMSFAQCSDAEYASPKCPVVRPSRTSVLRWVEAVSLITAKVRLVPAQAVFLGATDPAEDQFILPISTGAAAHVTLERALLSALLEVIERDALSLMWLLKASPPKIMVDTLSESQTRVWTALARSSSSLDYTFLDASSDIFIPVVVGIRNSPSEKMRNILACAASMHQGNCITKVIRDLNALSISFRVARPVPDQVEDFSLLHHGATYMAHAARTKLFSQLLSGPITSLRGAETSEKASPISDLQLSIAQIEKLGLEPFAVNVSTRESLALGLHVVKVIVPGLQPLPYHFRCRYLGSDRLRQASRSLMGRSYAEKEVNEWPIPFA